MQWYAVPGRDIKPVRRDMLFNNNNNSNHNDNNNNNNKHFQRTTMSTKCTKRRYENKQIHKIMNKTIIYKSFITKTLQVN